MEENQEQIQIPVLSVWKNNAILKNIFLINSPVTPQNHQNSKTHQQNHEIFKTQNLNYQNFKTHQQNHEIFKTQKLNDQNSKTHQQNHEIFKTQKLNDENFKTHQGFEEIFTIGRHPDCDIRLEHPSISRFHLCIHSFPSSKHLSIFDLCSVHGTFVSGQRIEPNVRTTLHESDTLRIGGSSRVYKLHWIPMSQAYDVCNPFVPPLDLAMPQEDDEEEEIIKDECSLGLENEEIQAVDSFSKDLEPVDVCDDEKLVFEQVTEEKVLPEENECVEQVAPPVTEQQVVPGDPDTEDLMSLLLDELLQLCTQEEVPPDPPIAKVNSEIVDNEIMQPLNPALEGFMPLYLGEKWEWVGQEGNYMVCPTEECMPVHMMPNLDISTARESSGIVSELIQNEIEVSLLEEDSQVSQGLDTFENSELDAEQIVPSLTSIMEDMAIHMKPNLDYPTVEERSSGMVSELVENESRISQARADIQVLEGLDTSENYEQFVPSMPEDISFHVAPNLGNPTADEQSNGMMSELIQIEERVSLPEEEGMWNFWCGSLVAPASLAFENNHFDQENQLSKSEPEVFSERQCLGSVDFSKNASIEDQNGSKLWSFWSGNMGVESSVCSSLSDVGIVSESENKTSRLSVPSSVCSSLSDVGLLSESENKTSEISVPSSVCSSLPDVGLVSESENITSGISVQSPPLSSIKRPLVSPLTTSDDKSESCLWYRRGKLQSAPQILTSRSEEKKLRSDQKNVKHEPLSRALFHDSNVQQEEEEEVFTPDKENFTPNTHRSMRKSAILKDVQNLSSGKSPFLKMTGSPSVYYEESMYFSSNKENHPWSTSLQKKTARCCSVNQGKSIRARKRNGEERMPFQSLLADSPKNSSPVTSFPDVTMTKDSFTSERIQKWSMIVDTTTLLNKESRKALQLLEGLKGTQLIIPKIVIKDLAFLKRQTSFFRRNTEVSSALDWIEDCMVKTQQWVRVQNSTEEGRPVAPTPPASPYSQASCGATAGPFTFASAFETQPELLSPTVEDHVLEYALSFRNNNNDGQLVLLSNDVTLKIKAMAEGIICETAEEFRKSLVNPFSERFLWTDSSPRGQTWSYSDDFVLREKFYPSSLKMSTKDVENVKGLKLILLHNSQYFELLTENRSDASIPSC